ncbi:hypothetical protein Barb6XT_01772 [Bacteroidales bacterium Barb6XT]|nr:hypothetical protein Barb6XT_01772 [Bacteroidales bacterium Barb6XT]
MARKIHFISNAEKSILQALTSVRKNLIYVFTQEEKTFKEKETVNTTVTVKQALKTFLEEAG